MAPHLLSTRLLQQHSQAAVVLLVVGDELAQCGEGDLIRHKVRPDGRALDPEVEHFPLAAGCRTQEVPLLKQDPPINISHLVSLSLTEDIRGA